MFLELQAVLAAQRRIEAAITDLSGTQKEVVRSVSSMQRDLHSALEKHGKRSTGPSTSAVRQEDPEGVGTLASNGFVSVFEDVAHRSTVSAEDCSLPPVLPAGWPASIPMRTIYDTGSPGVDINMQPLNPIDVMHRKVFKTDAKLDDPLLKALNWKTHALMLDPHGVFRIIFDFLSLLATIYDMSVYPYLLAFDSDIDIFVASLWFSTIFWTSDMIVEFFTGYYENGHVHLNFSMSAKRYIQSYFAADVLLVGLDWVSSVMIFVMEMPSSRNQLVTKILRILKFGRIVRLLGTVRTVKIPTRLTRLESHLTSDTARLATKMLSLMMAFLLSAHIMACMWYAVGSHSSATSPFRWVDMHIVDWEAFPAIDRSEFRFLHQSTSYQYLTALHWAVGCLSLDAIEINPKNPEERILNIISLTLGLLVSCSLISALSAAMVEFQTKRSWKVETMSKLRTYLQQNRIDRRLVVLVTAQVAERLRIKEKLKEEDVPALDLLSSSLRADLHFDMVRPSVLSHSFFALCANIDMALVQRMSASSVRIQHLRPNDELFTPEAASKSAFYMMHGELRYTQEPETSAVQEVHVDFVRPGSWIAEASLWTEWIHVGTAAATGQCEVLVFSSESMAQEMKRHRDIHYITTEYCRQYHRRMSAAVPPSAAYPHDLYVPFTEYADIVMAMDVNVRKIIGMFAMENAVSRAWPMGAASKIQALENLKQEVLSGKSTVMLNAMNEVQRVVSVVALEIEREDQSVFVELGKKGKDKTTARCTLPGTKADMGEMAFETYKRFLETKLTPFADSLQIEKTERAVECKHSKEYGVRTRYLRTVYSCRFQGQLDAPSRTVEWILSPAVQAGGNFKISEKSSMHSATNSKRISHLPTARKETTMDVFFFNDHDTANDTLKVTFYAWLSKEEYHFLSSQAGEHLLSEWMPTLESKIVFSV